MQKTSKILHDLVVVYVSLLVAFWIRLEFNYSSTTEYILHNIYIILLFPLFPLFSLVVSGSYRTMWRFSSIPDLFRLIQSISTGVLLATGALFFTNRLDGFPRSIPIIYWLVMIVFIGGSRLAYRIYLENRNRYAFRDEREDILVIGAGNAGEQICREILKNGSLKLNVIGFIDDDPAKRGQTLLGIKILGAVDDISEVAKSYQVKRAIIAIPSATNTQMRRIVSACSLSNVKFKTLPSTDSVFNDSVSLAQLRDIDPEDLLGREPVKLDLPTLGIMLKDKVVMVTGAGGSIGTELCKQIARFSPAKIVFFEISEFFLFNLDNDFKENFPEINTVPIVGDVRNIEKIKQVLKEYSPQIVFHAAAYKHVPLMESNSSEAVETNIIGTLNMTKAVAECGVEKMVLISTDKAVNPTNVMGATKRAAEIVCTLMQKRAVKTQYVVVRFGNVLGSNGSVIPTFKRQIERGGPVTITDPNITRFFMSIPEAAQLVLQATAMGRGGEIFVLDMGKPVRIIDLARDMIRLAGFEPERDIELKFIGLRPGEKMYEELFNSGEAHLKTTHEKVYSAKTVEVNEKWWQLLDEVLIKSKNSAPTAIKSLIMNLIKGY